MPASQPDSQSRHRSTRPCPDLCGRKPRKHAEHHRECLAVSQPHVSSEQDHSAPRHQGVGDHHRRNGLRLRRWRIRVLQPRKAQEEHERGPYTKPAGILEAQIEPPPRPDTRDQAVRPAERDAPRVNQCPQVAHQRNEEPHANPPHDPHEGRREVDAGVLVAPDSGGYHQRQQCD